MDIINKIRVLGAAAKYDNCGCSVPKTKEDNRFKDALENAIYETSTEGSRKTKLLKVLMSNSCKFDCKYCQNAAGGCKNPASFAPEELANAFDYLYKNNYVEGLFLSSAITSEPDRMAEKMVETAAIIRNKHKFRGYMHLKVLPGTSYDLVKQASNYAYRLSINLEAPSKSRISELSSSKDFKIDILRRQAWIKKMGLVAGQTTQFVVGASGETDLEILKMADWEYRNMNLKRTYYSTFSPLKGTALENKEKVPQLRGVRLYNIDFMMRKYGIALRDFEQIMKEDMLPKEDPKLALARETLEKPVDINEADFNELVRVPGIGTKTARKIIEIRQTGKISRYRELHEAGVILKRASPFIEVDGRRQATLTI